MHDFRYRRAASVEEASRLLSNLPDAKLLAGGMSLIPTLKLRMQRVSDLIDLCELGTLRNIALEGDELVVGAMTTHAAVAASEVVQKTLPALADLAGHIGDPHCRNRGTLGGSLSHADPAACYPSAVLALDATVCTNRRRIMADDFFTGLFDTALETGEIVTEVRFPVPDGARYMKFVQPASRFASVGVFVARRRGAARVAVTGCASHVFRVSPFEEALSRRFVPEALAGLELPADGLNSDIYADPPYRAHLIGVLAKRAVQHIIHKGV